MSGKSESLTWKDVVQQALRELGGEAHLRQINERIKGHPKTRTNPTWRDTVRRVVRQYAVFQPVGRSRSGVYRLIEEPSVEAHPARADHGTVQGMLLALGRMYGYETFAPAPDRTTKTFQGRPLADFTTVTDCAGFCGPKSLPRVRQIDTLWLAEDNEGAFPVYAFEVEHTTKVRSGMDRLVEIPERYSTALFVVAPGDAERRRFDVLLNENRFRRFRKRLYFRDYPRLEALYNAAVQHDEVAASFGVSQRRA